MSRVAPAKFTTAGPNEAVMEGHGGLTLYMVFGPGTAGTLTDPSDAALEDELQGQ